MAKTVKKYKLDVSVDALNEVTAIGIITAESELQLSLELNRLSNIQPAFDQTIEIKQRQQILPVNLFRYIDEETEMQYILVKNKISNSFFSKEYSQVDYILLIYGEQYKKEGDLILEKIKNSQVIQTCLLLELGKLKSLKHIPF